MRRLLAVVLVTLLTACTAPALRPDAAASEVRDITDLAAVAPAFAESHARTLLVLDIDDTLLTSEGFYGSDTWYEWQSKLPASDPDKLPCIFSLIALNYEAGTQLPTQPDGPALINAIHADKLLLTSRSAFYRGGTLRTLASAGYALPAMLGGISEGRSWDFRKAPDAKPMRVVYDQGLFMTTGQDKGKVLLDLFRELRIHYDRVVLVDDGQQNIDNMRAALLNAGIDYLGLHYVHVDKSVTPERIAAARAGWQHWRSLLEANYPHRLQAMEQGKCNE
ncbi:MAG: DUF2608 domain-containing protein [Thermomonas sp.]|uniref:DUF2608 domain-containing protein n=1 Tax=Thermomonas sp. TaxID=1971895 RepID=UPI002621F118|nr:DUF2608 domain-containing protein [Thermomonas sp.]MCC7096951.1 DUF2608 domain-containing protein [Thermomonas sp.]